MTDLRTALADMAGMWRKLGQTGEGTASLYAAVAEHGTTFAINREQSAPSGYLKDCFQNATHAALWEDGLTYCEGFATRGRTPFPVHHAWLANEDGEAIEVTWRDGGRECGFCDEGIRTEDAYDEDGDPDGYEEVECRFCGGTGESDHEHESLEDAQYVGFAIDRETLNKIILRNGVYGAITTPQDLTDILAAREEQT